MQTDESRTESIQEEARKAKAIAVEKYNAGDLAGAKEFAVKAKNLDPELCGLGRLNAVLDVKMGFEKKNNNGEVDWYAVLSAEPTEELGTIQGRYRKIANTIIHDRDDSIGGVAEAEKIIADAFRYFVKEKTNQIYAKRKATILQAKQASSSSSVSGHVNQLSGISGEESKRKEPPPTDESRVHQLRRLDEDAGTRGHDSLELRPDMVGSTALVVNTESVIKPSLKSYGPASPDKTAVKTRTLEDLMQCEEAKIVTIDESKNTTYMVNYEEEPYEVVMSVPDADFHNFDDDRTEASFGENQVWAAYDEYGMPRYYALVRSVVSQEPFKVCISWLNCKKNDEIGPMKWLESGYYKTSGRFSIGKRGNNLSDLNSFSHRVEWTKGAKGLVYIYPKKGNVWALYTNWSPSWDITLSLDVMNKYDMVEVLEDFDEEGGTVTVAPLVKLPGFHTVFRRGQSQRTYPREELFRFSHQVAYYVITGEEGENAPKGCLELDPAALSPDLLMVLTEEEMRENGEENQ